MSPNKNSTSTNKTSSTRSKTNTTMRSTKVGDTDKSKTMPHPTTLDTTETVNALKTTRDFEHSRQRAMKTVQVKNWKEEKAWNRHVKLELRKLQPSLPPSPQPIRRPGRGFVRSFRGTEDADKEWDVSTETEWECEEVEVAPTWRAENRIEVDLTHLIRPAKSRKARSKRFSHLNSLRDLFPYRSWFPTAGDFELVPKVRSVVVLDDGTDEVPEVDDPWEYVSADEEGILKKPVFSYAQVVTNVR